MPNEVVAGLLLSVDAKTVSARREIDALRNTMRESSREMRADMAETRAAMKQIGEEIGVNLNRHLIGFLAKIPGADVFAKAFPVAAIVGVGAALVESGKKLGEFIIKNKEVAGAIGEGMETIQRRTAMTNDQLSLTNAKLDVQIAKLEHKPANSLAVALAEARVEADRLADSLRKDLDEVDKLLKQHKVSFFGGLLTNQATTGDSSDKVKKFADALKEIDDHKIAALQGLTDPKKIAEVTSEFDKEWLRKATEARDWAAGEWNRLRQAALAPPSTRMGPHGVVQELPREDTTALQTIAGTFGHQMEAEINSRNLQIQQAALQSKLAGLQGAKSAADERLHAIEQEAERRKLLHEMTLGDEALYWQKYIGVFTEGSEQWIAVMRHFQESSAQVQKNFIDRGKLYEPLKKYRLEQAMPVSEAAGRDVGAEMLADQGRYGERWREYNNALAENAQIHERLQGALEVTNLKIAAETGQITRQQAAWREAQIQLDTYHAQAQAVRDQMGGIRSDTSIPDVQRATQLQQLQNKLDEITGQAAIKQAETDALAKGVQLRESMAIMFNEWIERATDVRAELTSLWNQFSSSMNDEMAKAITGARTNWSGAFRGLAESTVRMGLGNIEGPILKHIPFLKNAQSHTVAKMDVNAGVVNIGGGAGAGPLPGMPGGGGPGVAPASSHGWSTALRTIGGLLGLVRPAASAGLSSAGYASGMGADAFGATTDYQIPYEPMESFNPPAMAFGGPVLAGQAYDIGEMGRERFVPETNGHIVPNHALGGGGAFYQIDARGASAAEVEQRVSRAIMRAHGSAVQSAIAVQGERRRRIPNRNM